MPLVNRTFDQLIDFTRTSAATFVNSSGNIASTPQSRNLLTFTQEFDNAVWVKTNSQIVPNGNPSTLSGELRGSGTIGLVGTATAATYNTSTGAGSVTRVDGSNQSYVEFAASASSTYLFTIENTSGADIFVRPTGFGTSIMTIGAGQTLSRYLSGNANYYITSSSGTLTFNVVSVRQVTGALQAPDGTFTADTLVALPGTGTHNVAQSGGGSGAALTLSVYAKAGTSSFVQLYHGSASTIYANFNLATGAVGTVGAGATAAITSVGNGWYRCAITFTPGSASASRVAMITSGTAAFAESWTAAGTETIFLWGAQLEQASAATDYTRNFGGLFPPRFDYDPVTRAPRGLLIEEQRTNLLVRSEEFDNAAWTLQRATVTANAATSPDGTADADRLVDDTATGTHRVFQAVSKAASAIAYTGSVYLKADTLGFATVRIAGLAEGAYTSVGINLSTGELSALGTVGFTSASAAVANAGNGWWRVALTGTSDTTTSISLLVGTATSLAAGSSYTGTGTGSIYIYGAQLEAGAFATSYIPTVASQVTRAADTALIQAPMFASWYNSAEGTLLVEGTISPNVDSAVGNYYAAISDGTTSNTILIAEVNGSTSQVVTGGVIQFNETVGSEPTGTVKVALAYATNNTVSASNGTLGSTDTSVSIPTVNRLNIGSRGDLVSTGFANGHIRSIRYYPARLSNAQLQALTA